MKAVYHWVKVAGVVILLWGGGNTWSLFCIIKLVWPFLNWEVVGRKKLKFALGLIALAWTTILKRRSRAFKWNKVHQNLTIIKEVRSKYIWAPQPKPKSPSECPSECQTPRAQVSTQARPKVKAQVSEPKRELGLRGTHMDLLLTSLIMVQVWFVWKILVSSFRWWKKLFCLRAKPERSGSLPSARDT